MLIFVYHMKVRCFIVHKYRLNGTHVYMVLFDVAIQQLSGLVFQGALSTREYLFLMNPKHLYRLIFAVV